MAKTNNGPKIFVFGPTPSLRSAFLAIHGRNCAQYVGLTIESEEGILLLQNAIHVAEPEWMKPMQAFLDSNYHQSLKPDGPKFYLEHIASKMNSKFQSKRIEEINEW